MMFSMVTDILYRRSASARLRMKISVVLLLLLFMASSSNGLDSWVNEAPDNIRNIPSGKVNGSHSCLWGRRTTCLQSL